MLCIYRIYTWLSGKDTAAYLHAIYCNIAAICDGALYVSTVDSVLGLGNVDKYKLLTVSAVEWLPNGITPIVFR